MFFCETLLSCCLLYLKTRDYMLGFDRFKASVALCTICLEQNGTKSAPPQNKPTKSWCHLALQRGGLIGPNISTNTNSFLSRTIFYKYLQSTWTLATIFWTHIYAIVILCKSIDKKVKL